MSFSMKIDNSFSPPLLKCNMGKEFTGEDFDQWLMDYDKIMSAQTETTNVIFDMSKNKSVHTAIRRMFSKMDFPDRYPHLGWTVLWGGSRIVATTVQFVGIANKNLRIKYANSEAEALAFLADQD